jgi:hypothetical protein
VVANSLQILIPLFLNWRDWWLYILFPSEPIIEVKFFLND